MRVQVGYIGLWSHIGNLINLQPRTTYPIAHEKAQQSAETKDINWEAGHRKCTCVQTSSSGKCHFAGERVLYTSADVVSTLSSRCEVKAHYLQSKTGGGICQCDRWFCHSTCLLRAPDGILDSGWEHLHHTATDQNSLKRCANTVLAHHRTQHSNSKPTLQTQTRKTLF